MLKKIQFSIVILFVILYSIGTQAMQTPSQSDIEQALNRSNSSSFDVSDFMQTTQKDIGRGTLSSSSNYDGHYPQPYGANLFSGSFEAQRSDGLNNNYLVAPGDKIAIQMWGAVEFSEIVSVDNQGNIFVTDVGPIKVKDVPANRLNALVTNRIKTVFTNNVSVYVNLLTATPVSVFVTGAVERPGQYAGLASDSLLFYLQRAGGIDAVRGSYRKIDIFRNNNLVNTYDLYEFLRNGKLEEFSFQDRDVVLVRDRGTTVTIEGTAKYTYRFETNYEKATGSEIIELGQPLYNASHVAVEGTRENGPFFVYLTINDFKEFEAHDGDTILFNSDLRPQQISVSVSGSYVGPSFYTLNKNTKLRDFLAHVEVTEGQADYKNIYIKRKSVAEKQKQLIDDSLNRLERSVFTAPTRSTGEASIRVQEAQLLGQFISNARNVKPLGKVIVSEGDKVANILLEDDDEIVIPAITDLIHIGGEVLMPQAFVFNDKATITDYVAWAGGFTERANDEQIVVIRANGVTEFFDTEGIWFSSQSTQQLQAGDQILILPKVDTKLLQSVKDITQIIYQIAIAANAIN